MAACIMLDAFMSCKDSLVDLVEALVRREKAESATKEHRVMKRPSASFIQSFLQLADRLHSIVFLQDEYQNPLKR